MITLKTNEKVWVFYQVRDSLGRSIPDQLYAFTQDKDTKKLFETMRDMSLFRCQKYRSLNEFLNTRTGLFEAQVYQRYLLRLTPFRTVVDNEYVTVELLCTWLEEERSVLLQDRLYNKLQEQRFPPLTIFKKSIQNALRNINYDNFVKWIYEKDVIFGGQEYVKDQLEYDRFNKEEVDEVSAFMRLYGYTLKGDLGI